MGYDFAMNCQFDGPVLNKIYEDAFGYKSDGVFVEVGARKVKDDKDNWTTV